MSKFISDVSEMIVKEYYITILIKDMDISYFMVHSQQIEEEKLKDREEYRNKKAKTENESTQHNGGSSRPPFQNRRSMHHHLLVHLRLEKDLSIMVRTPKLGMHIQYGTRR